MRTRVCCFNSASGFTLLAAVFLTILIYEWGSDERLLTLSGRFFGAGITSSTSLSKIDNNRENRQKTDVLPILIQKGIYSEDDFVNDLGLEVPYWNRNGTLIIDETKKPTEWGPCFATHETVDWEDAIIRFYNQSKLEFHTSPPLSVKGKMDKVDEDLAGYCRPGFIIIGAGKCGTSSLYHYLVDHPRILPASEKQIHYFRYYATRPMKWYLHHFPTAPSFLAAGALLTGEASPGYLPYPDVARSIADRLPSGPKIIVVGREPIDRAYSSYRYNYVTPTLEMMRKGRARNIEAGQNDEYYDRYLFSFEDMMRAELDRLRSCLSPVNGSAVLEAHKKWGSLFRAEYERRERLQLDPLVDLDGFCYGNAESGSRIIRPQWKELMEKYPEKVIGKSNTVHLTQSFIGRGLYALPLEWWYATFDPTQIYFVCTEELSDMSGEPMNLVTQFLGLKAYNFTEIVSSGAYNVGGHRGYDNAVAWSTVKEERNPDGNNKPTSRPIPLSKEFREELEDFIRPFNDRLFKLVGRRCDW